jgi:signal transduction histidine kinase
VINNAQFRYKLSYLAKFKRGIIETGKIMKPNNRLLPILLLINLLIILSTAYGEVVSDTKTDSLRIALDKENGSDKISIKLDLALHIHENEKNEAESLAKSALKDARIEGNKTLEMRSYYVLGRIYLALNNMGFSNSYYDTALTISESIDDNWYKGEILFRRGLNQYNEGKVVLALESFYDALQPCSLSDNFKVLGSSYSMMGTILRLNGIYDRAIEYIIKSKLNYEKANFTEGYAWADYLVGRIHADLNLPKEARKNFEQALATYWELASIDGNRNGVALCLEQIGLLNMEAGNLDQALENIENVLKIHSESESKDGILNTYKHLGQINYYMGNYTLAEDYLNKALIIKKEIGDLTSRPGIYEYMGLCLIKRGRVEEGFNNIHKGLEQAILNNQKKFELDIYSKLVEIHSGLGDYEKAIFYQNKQIEIQNLILSGAAGIKMEQLQGIYEIDIKNSQIAELEKQNEISSLKIKHDRTIQIIMIIGILLAFFISVIIFLFYNKIRLKNHALNEANATKDKLFSIIAHDLRGPIGTVFGLSEYLVEEIKNNNLLTAKKFASLIHQNLNDTYNLLNDLLDWARSQLQKIEFNPRHLVLFVVINEVKNLLSVQAEKKNISLKINVEKSHQALADGEMLKTILRNLISNAIKFSNANGEITIFTKINDNFIELSVRDNGVGIAPNALKNLFYLESNISTPGTSGEKGTGLGLILVKDFVEKNGGEIWVESEVQRGSIFSFTLPIN